MNQKNHKSKSGIRGVTWHAKSKTWMAYMKKNNKFKNLGYYKGLDKAIEARKKAEEIQFGEFMRKS